MIVGFATFRRAEGGVLEVRELQLHEQDCWEKVNFYAPNPEDDIHSFTGLPWIV